ncbi:MAG: biopolymer transporter ExbD [Pseudomonadota bacterium]
MSRRNHSKRHNEQVELDITTFLNLMVVLIPFLLITAVFSRITIQELNLPTEAAGGAKPDEPLVTIEVIVRKDKLQLSNGNQITATIEKKDDKYDLRTLSNYLLELKRKYSEKEDATILVEPDIEYEDVIHVMDAVKVAELDNPDKDAEPAARQAGEPQEIEKMVLFPKLSLGDAP